MIQLNPGISIADPPHTLLLHPQKEGCVLWKPGGHKYLSQPGTGDIWWALWKADLKQGFLRPPGMELSLQFQLSADLFPSGFVKQATGYHSVFFFFFFLIYWYIEVRKFWKIFSHYLKIPFAHLCILGALTCRSHSAIILLIIFYIVKLYLMILYLALGYKSTLLLWESPDTRCDQLQTLIWKYNQTLFRIGCR